MIGCIVHSSNFTVNLISLPILCIFRCPPIYLGKKLRLILLTKTAVRIFHLSRGFIMSIERDSEKELNRDNLIIPSYTKII